MQEFNDLTSAKVIADSISDQGKRITTLELTYWRPIHSELLTHRVFSRNAMSSRAIPVAKMIDQVRNNPARPVHWGKNQPGMQANEQLTGRKLEEVKSAWMDAALSAANIAEYMDRMGAHKQIANRILEPFQWMRTIVTSTEWSNFFELRCHPDAQPEFQKLAHLMRDAMIISIPAPIADNDWHMPYVETAYSTGTMIDGKKIMGRQLFIHTLADGSWHPIDLETALKASTARCARVSYLTHEGKVPDLDKDIELYDRLVGSVPIHASPTEHQAQATLQDANSGNFKGWRQHRKMVEFRKMVDSHTSGKAGA
jgi:thymidylate synthase ThyX